MSHKKLFIRSTFIAVLLFILLLMLNYFLSQRLLQQNLSQQHLSLQQGYQLQQQGLQTNLQQFARLLAKTPDFIHYIEKDGLLDQLHLNWDKLQHYFSYPIEFIDFMQVSEKTVVNHDNGLQLNDSHQGFYTQVILDNASDVQPQWLILGSPFLPLLQHLDKTYASGFAVVHQQTVLATSRTDIPDVINNHQPRQVLQHHTLPYLLVQQNLSVNGDSDVVRLLIWKNITPLMQQFWQQQASVAGLLLLMLLLFEWLFYHLTLKNCSRLNNKTVEQYQQISNLKNQINNLNLYDNITQLPNKRYFNQYIEQEITRCTRTGAPISILMVAVDDYHRLYQKNKTNLNDSVKQLVILIKTTLRDTDILCYYGEGVFCAALIETNITGADIVTQRLHVLIKNNIFHKQALRVSMGLTQWQEESYEINLLSLVAKALKTAQNNGGNQICVV